MKADKADVPLNDEVMGLGIVGSFRVAVVKLRKAVWNCEKGIGVKGYHCRTHPITKFFNLLSYIPDKGITEPYVLKHYGVCFYFVQVHRHCSSGANGMAANFVGGEA